jgi:hypothetical protein
VFLGLGPGNGEPPAQPLRKAFGDIDGAMALTLAFAPQLHLTRLFFPDTGVYQRGGNLHSPQLVPAARSLPVLGPVLRHAPDSFVPWMLGVFALVVGSALFCLVLAIFFQIGTLAGNTCRPPELLCKPIL